MVDWKSLEELKRDIVAFDRVVHIWLGIYLWEWITSLEFDWQFLTRKKKFTWPMIFYFLNRYCSLFALIGLVIAQDVTTKFDCQALYTFNQVFACASIGFASINLSIRTIAIWTRKWYIVFPIVAIILGHWSLLLHGVFLKVVWVPDRGCTLTQTNNQIMSAIFIYTMAFDFIVMLLTAIKLNSPSSRQRSKLTQLIFQDGLIYFIIVFLTNVVTTTFMLLDLNPEMSVITSVPGVAVASIAACRIVRRLNTFTTDKPQIFSSSNLAFHSFATSGVHSKVSKNPDVRMETFPSPSLTKGDAEYPSRSHAFDPKA